MRFRDSTTDSAAAHAPSAPATWRVLTPRLVDYWLHVFRRTWKGTIVTSFAQPWLYLAAMGVLLGDYVDAESPGVGGAPSYLAFVAPGLLAAQAMQVAAGETMWPVLGRIKWDRAYYGMIATPLRVTDVVLGHLGYTVLRIAVSTLPFVLVLASVGLFDSVTGAVVCWCAALLTGAALATPIYGYAAGASSEQGFALIFRVAVMPMFLFSGAFFPISNLPESIRWVAQATPLWHGVELCRMASLETWDGSAALIHVAYLGTLAGLGTWWSVRRLTRRLVV